MKKQLLQIIYLLFLFQQVQCQNKEKNVPEFHVEISHPNNKYSIRPISDKIKTLEGIPAGLPYGGSSGVWGDSGSTWTEQHGTPIGADIIYFSEYENKFYRLNIDFDKDYIQKMMKRAYARTDDKKTETKEYKELGRFYESNINQPYDSFSHLVFRFAPKGMVVVWLRFGIGNTQIELGRFQAELITDEQSIAKAKQKYIDDFGTTEEHFNKVIKEYLNLDASSVLWDNYRKRFQWSPQVVSKNKNFELLQIITHYYNGERENMLRPWVEKPLIKQRAIPSQIQVFWQTGKNENERLVAEIYLNWGEVEKKLNSAQDKNIYINISEDNNEINLTVEGNSLKADSIRIFPWPLLLDQSYKNID